MLPVEGVDVPEQPDLAQDASQRGAVQRREERRDPGKVRAEVHGEHEREALERGACSERQAVRQQDGCDRQKKKKEEREREREVLERVTKGSARQAAGGAAIPGHGSITLLYC